MAKRGYRETPTPTCSSRGSRRFVGYVGGGVAGQYSFTIRTSRMGSVTALDSVAQLLHLVHHPRQRRDGRTRLIAYNDE